MPDLVTRVEFGRRIKKSEKWVRKLIAAGKIPVTSGGKIDWVQGFEAYCSAYPGDGSDASAPISPETAGSLPPWPPDEPPQPVLPADPTSPAVGPQADPQAAPQRAMSTADVNAAYNRAKLREKQVVARRKEIELDTLRGHLIPVDEVRADAVAVLASVRASLLALPGQVALRCEGKGAAEIDGVIADAVNVLLAEWHQGRFGT